jgi:hypothetical protein
MLPDEITPPDAATPPQPPRCRHVLIPGEANCLDCGEQILYTGLGQTHWQRFAAWVAGWFTFLMADNNSTTLPARRTDDPQAGETSNERS